ncbi:hypothetical protein ACKWTF_008714 [Chironomus riparius]
MKRELISVAFLLWQCHLILGKPGVVDSPEIRKRAISTTLTSYNNVASGSKADSAEKSTSNQPETPPIDSGFKPMKITYEDVVTGGNSIYGSQFPFTSGGIVFAIGQGVQSPPHMTAAHPQSVLLQYLSPEGMPKQTAVQYVQLLRPVMMVPSQPYLPPQSISMDIQTETAKPIFTKPTIIPYRSYSKPSSTIIGAHSAPLTSYIQSDSRPLIKQPELDITLNMNEYVPAASSRISTSILTPQVASMTSYKPSKFSMISQRA